MKFTVDTFAGTISIENMGDVVTCNAEFLYDLLTMPVGTVIQSMGRNDRGDPVFKSFVMPNLELGKK